MADTGTFGSSVKTSGKLHQMLGQPSLTPQQLFAIPNISGDIIQNIQTFLNFCLKRRQFTTRMLDICLNSNYQQLQDEGSKKVAQHTIEVLTNDEDALCNFLFGSKKDQGLDVSSKVEQKITEQSTQNIQTQAERLFESPRRQTPSWQSQSSKFAPHELIILTLSHLNPQISPKNQTCLGYINKVYSSLLRRDGNLFLQFLKQHPEYIDLLIKNIEHFSIGNIVALALACEDKTGEYVYEGLKKDIFARIVQFGINNLSDLGDLGRFQGFLGVIEEILNSTKQSYYQYFEDFKRCANVLVSQQTLRRFFNLLSKDEASFGNASSYLQLILKRINSQSEQPDYYRQNQHSQPTMKFQHNFLYSEPQVSHMLQLISKSKNYTSIRRTIYLGFLISLIKHAQGKGIQVGISYPQMFKTVMIDYCQQKAGGLVKNYLFQLLKLYSKKITQDQAKPLAQWLISQKFQHQALQKIFSSSQSLPTQNSSLTSCFMLNLLFQVQQKQPTLTSDYDKQNNINLSNIFDKYKTKLANYGQDEDTSPGFDDVGEINFRLAVGRNNGLFVKDDGKKEDTANVEKVQRVEVFDWNDRKMEIVEEQQIIVQRFQKPIQKQKQQTQVVGKNSVVIPVLHLPNKNESHKNQPKITIQQQAVQPFKLPAEMSRQALIRDLKNTRIQLPDKFKPKKQIQKVQGREEIQKNKEKSPKIEKINMQKLHLHQIQNPYSDKQKHNGTQRGPQSPLQEQSHKQPQIQILNQGHLKSQRETKLQQQKQVQPELKTQQHRQQKIKNNQKQPSSKAVIARPQSNQQQKYYIKHILLF